MTRLNTLLRLSLFGILLYPFTAAKAQVTAASCNTSDVQSAINAATTGQTVTVPAGTCTWSGLTIAKPLALTGAGIGATNITLSVGASQSTITKQTTGIIRISGFSFTVNGAGGDLSSQNGIQIAENSGARWPGTYPVVIQNCSFDVNGANAIHSGPPGGIVISHVAVTGHSGTLNGDEFLSIYDNQDTAGSWSKPDTMGVRDTAATLSGTIPGTSGFLNVYVEDSTFTNMATLIGDWNDGSRVVARHNTFTDAEINSHGKGTSPYGQRHWEIYNNNFKNTASEGGACDPYTNTQNNIWFKGGTGVIFNNTSDSLNTSCWGNKPEVYFAVDSDGPSGCPSSSASYPLSHQLGQNNNGTSDFTDPAYLWNNTINPGTGVSPFTLSVAWMYSCATPVSGFMQSGRDYVDNSTNTTAKPGYTPYTYPHPLVAGATGQSSAPPAPTGLVAVVH